MRINSRNRWNQKFRTKLKGISKKYESEYKKELLTEIFSEVSSVKLETARQNDQNVAQTGQRFRSWFKKERSYVIKSLIEKNGCVREV